MKSTKNKAPRNPIKVAMDLRYGTTNTTHRHRSDRRPKDAKRSWKNEDQG